MFVDADAQLHGAQHQIKRVDTILLLSCQWEGHCDVACFFGCQIARSLRGNPSIDCTWSTHEPLDRIDTCMESMPKNAFRDIYYCLHFDDDWDKDNKWDKV
jgi:hypothetical protein